MKTNDAYIAVVAAVVVVRRVRGTDIVIRVFPFGAVHLEVVTLAGNSCVGVGWTCIGCGWEKLHLRTFESNLTEDTCPQKKPLQDRASTDLVKEGVDVEQAGAV